MNQESLSELELERRTVVNKFWLFATLLFALVSGIYILKFGWGMPENPAIWGAFGDYFGGILNSIIGLANLVVLVYLTLTVSVIDQKRQDRDIETQKAIGVVSLKYAVAKDFNDFFNQVQRYFMARELNEDPEYMFFVLELQSAARINASLFTFLKDDETWMPLANAIQTVGLSRDELVKTKKTGEGGSSFEAYLDEFGNFIRLKDNFQDQIREVLAAGWSFISIEGVGDK